MTLAEDRLKRAVVELIAAGVYPGTVAVCRRLGFSRLRPDLNGREMRWRAEVLEAAGWRHETEGSRSWSPPPEASWVSRFGRA